MRHKSTGFSLLEMLIAFAIFSLSISVLLKIFSSGVNHAILAEDYTDVTQIAQSLMARTGTETVLQKGVSVGDEGKYHWQVTVEPYQPAIKHHDFSTLGVVLFKIIVQVTWDDDFFQHRQFDLIQLKISNKVQ